MNKILNTNKNSWQRLEDLLVMMQGSSVKALSRTELREFGDLYRRAAADLAIARAETRDPQLIGYLNSLVIRAHGKIYRAESQGVGIFLNFFTRELPETFRKNWRYMAFAIAIFVGFAIFGAAATWQNLEFMEFVMLQGLTEQIRANNHWWKDLNEANSVGAAHIMSNNIIVTLRVFATGAFFGVGAFYDLAFEGARLGSVFAACFKINPAFGNELGSFVVGHGVIELSVICFCAGAGMMIGYSLIDPGELTRLQALKRRELKQQKLFWDALSFF